MGGRIVVVVVVVVGWVVVVVEVVVAVGLVVVVGTVVVVEVVVVGRLIVVRLDVVDKGCKTTEDPQTMVVFFAGYPFICLAVTNTTVHNTNLMCSYGIASQ